jgi:hypothetical protein
MVYVFFGPLVSLINGARWLTLILNQNSFFKDVFIFLSQPVCAMAICCVHTSMAAMRQN